MGCDSSGLWRWIVPSPSPTQHLAENAPEIDFLTYLSGQGAEVSSRASTREPDGNNVELVNHNR